MRQEKRGCSCSLAKVVVEQGFTWDRVRAISGGLVKEVGGR